LSYFFKWIPVVAIAAIFILSLPWLGLIALLVLLVMLAPLAAAIVYAPYRLGRAIVHRYAHTTRRGAGEGTPARAAVRDGSAS
jgi:membrane protein implicated in regulation of membrane protease activity